MNTHKGHGDPRRRVGLKSCTTVHAPRHLFTLARVHDGSARESIVVRAFLLRFNTLKCNPLQQSTDS
jgi:hypothetical protein